jgi:dTDP-4-dehydrorhamnose 3,5-epimerase
MIQTIHKTPFEGLIIIEPKVWHDERGYFYETFQKLELIEAIGNYDFVQDNLSHSKKNVIRGLHYQINPHAQGKLVTVLKGKVLDVVVDLRMDKPTFGKNYAIELSDENHLLFFIPPGFAHGFSCLSDECLFYYKCTGYFHKPAERGILWNDSSLCINWRVIDPIVSTKDQQLPVWTSVQDFF